MAFHSFEAQRVCTTSSKFHLFRNCQARISSKQGCSRQLIPRARKVHHQFPSSFSPIQAWDVGPPQSLNGRVILLLFCHSVDQAMGYDRSKFIETLDPWFLRLLGGHRLSSGWCWCWCAQPWSRCSRCYRRCGLAMVPLHDSLRGRSSSHNDGHQENQRTHSASQSTPSQFVGKSEIDRFGQMGTYVWVSVHQHSGSLMSVKSYSHYSPAAPPALALIIIDKTEWCWS